MDAVFLDRDGVINENRADYVKTWAEFDFLPNAPEAIARLARVGIPVFVVTNQAAINQGLVTRATADEINSRMMQEIERRGGRIEAVAYCPHLPREECNCRKPRPGLLLHLARNYSLDFSKTVFIGDALSDIEAGQAVGCQTILVLTGRGREQLAMAQATGRNGFRVASDLYAAVNTVLQLSPGTPKESVQGLR